MSAQLEHIESSAALAPAARAAIALDSAKHRKELAELVLKSAGIVAVSNADGREEAHRAGMVLKTARVTIQKRGKEAREDATAFSKAVIAEEKTLVDLIAPEEERVLGLRDKWDAQVEAERQAKIAAERERVEALQRRVALLRNIPATMTGKSAAEISNEIGYLAGSEPGASFEEFEEQAKAARLEALNQLAKMETEQRGVEHAQEVARQEAVRQRLEQEEEAARLKAEREELARLRAEQAQRMEAEQRQQREAMAAERAEADRIRKLEDEARAFKLQQERAELERQNEAMRLERARMAQEQAMLDESRRVAAEAEAERVQLQAAADQALEDAHKPAPAALIVETTEAGNPGERERLVVCVRSAQLELAAAVKDLADFDAQPENNVYPSLEAAEALEYVLWDRAHEDCEGAGNCGAQEYRQEFLVGGAKYVAIFTPEYNRHDKTYYYIDGIDFRIESCEVAQAA
jgi:hypothetical protein